MGAQISRETAAGGDGAGSGSVASVSEIDAFRRAWREGVPFTLLHDESFVAEKYQELKTMAKNSLQSEEPGAGGEAQVISGTNGVPMEELQQVTDLARMRLFSKRRKPQSALSKSVGSDASGATASSDSTSSSSLSDSSESSHASSVLTAAMADKILLRDSAESVASEKLRVQRTEIVQHYFAQLAGRLGSQTSRVDNASSFAEVQIDSATVSSTPSLGSSGVSAAISGSSPGGVFSVSSFRVQLEMLKEFRIAFPRLFESSVLTIVQTLLDFPPFALQSADLTSSEQALISDTHDFCRSILDPQKGDVAESHRQAMLLLLLAFGVSSGRVSLLLDFTNVVLHGATSTSASSTQLLHGRSFGSWVEAFLTRLESYRIDFSLGTFEETTLVKQFPIKLVATGDGVSENDKLPRTESVAADGSFIYAWSSKTGIAKIGTGLNFTIAGRVYAESGPAQYIQSFQRQRVFRVALYGSGRDVSEAVRAELWKSRTEPSRSSGREIRDVCATSDLDDLLSAFFPRKMLVLFSVDGVHKQLIFNDDDELDASTFVRDGCEREASSEDVDLQVLSAFYGDFEVLGDEVVKTLQEKIQVASNTEQETEGSVPTLTSEVLAELLADFDGEGVIISESTGLILFYSVEGEDALEFRNYKVGEQISGTEDPASDIYRSSLVYCGDSLYLSVLCSASDAAILQNSKRGARKPRRLIRVSPQDLSVIGVHALVSDDVASSIPVSKPLFTYISEGMYVYEIEMGADGFNVRVYFPKVSVGGSMKMSFVRSFPIDITQLQCPKFANSLLSILTLEMSVCSAEFDLPVMYTNGVWLAMMVSSTAQPGEMSHCVLLNCENGEYVEDPSSAKCIERVVPGRHVCFDAKNNLLWALDNAKGSLTSYRNTGKRISLSKKLSPVQILDQARQSTTDTEQGNGDSATFDSGIRFEDTVAVRVLGFLSQNADASAPNESSALLSFSQAKLGTAGIPFVADLRETSFRVLLERIKEYAALFQANSASPSQTYCLQACLRILNANIVLLLRARSSSTYREVVKVLREELSAPLASLTQSTDANEVTSPQEHGSSDELPSSVTLDGQCGSARLEVISTALDLYATCMHIFHSDVVQQFEGVLKYLKSWKNGTISTTELKIAGRLLGNLSNRVEDLQQAVLDSGETFDKFKQLIDCAVAVQMRKIDGVVACSSSSADKPLPPDEDAFLELTMLINSVSQSMFLSLARTATGPKTLEKDFLVLSVFRILSDGCESVCALAAERVQRQSIRKKSWSRVENALRRGFMGIISPMLFSSALAFLRNRDAFAAKISSNPRDTKTSEDGGNQATSLPIDTTMFGFLTENAQHMMSLLKSMDVLVRMIEPEAQEKTVESVIVAAKLETMESAHEYANNLDELNELRIPGATRIIVSFDARSRTEFNYDYVTFFKDRTRREYYGEQHYSGRDAEYNWPGVGSNPPLVIESDHCYVAFHSDGSNTDWGFKFAAKGEILQKKVSVKRHWMIFLTESIVHVLDESIKIFVDGSFFSPLDEAEFLNERFLQSDLVKNGICAEQNQNTNVLQLLKDFVNPPEHSQAANVVQALLSRSGTLRQRSVSAAASFAPTPEPNPSQSINSAVRAVAAAILHHNMWGMDAYAFAQNLRSDVSEQLLRGWKNAQKMRDWFHLGDAADAGIHRPGSPTRRRSRKLRRQPSAFKGMSEESLLILCANVIERAQFLLELTPASFSYVSGAKRRWGLLAKYGHAIGKVGSSESALDKWYNLLDELQAATELRSLFQYRRNSSERMRGGQAKSVTEQVLEFIQSDVDVEELRRIIEARDTRARSRAFGFGLFAGTWQCCSSVRVKSILAESFATTLKKMVQSYTFSGTTSTTPSGAVSPRVHFDLKLSGCQESLRQDVTEAYGKCLTEFSNMINSIPSLDHSNCALIIGVLKSCALDYDLDDSYLLQESRILTQILRLLSSNVIQIRRAAQSVLGVFLSRFVVGKAGSSPESSGQYDNEDFYDPTAFQRQLFTAVGLQLEGIVSVVNAPALNAQATVDVHGRGLQCASSQQHHYLPDSSPGLTAPCLRSTGVSWNHSIMVWVYVYGENSIYALKVGDEVRRGPDWKEGSEDDGGERETGVVSAIIHPTKIEVRWHNNNSVGEYTFDPKAGVFEVILVDQGVGGVIFFKGNKTMVKETAFAAPWSSFGLFLTDQRQLSYKIACGAERECVYHSNYEIDINEWTHIAIVQEEDTLRFFVNGTMASQHVLDPFLLMHGNVNAGESKIIESAHPYPESVDQYWPVHIPGAVKIRVTFDPLCDIDRSTGFVRFYKNARCNDFWGEEKYSGKYHDPERNFPGAQSHRARGRRNAGTGFNSLVPSSVEIPSDRFLVYFHNEDASSGWGFRLLAVPQYPADANLEFHEHGRTSTPLLNPYPFYFGEPPSRVLDEAAARCTMFQPKVLHYPISESDIIAEIQATCPGSETVPVPPPSERLLHILGLIQTCSETPFGRSLIGTPENIGNLMFLALDVRTAAELRCASLAILRDLVAYLSPEVAAAQFQRMFPHAVSTGFAEHLFTEIADSLNVWRKYAEDESVDAEHTGFEEEGLLELRGSAQEATSLVAGYISLLRSMSAHFNWSESIVALMSASIAGLKTLKSDATGDMKTLDGVLASCALLGGNYDGITIGGRVKCCVNIDGKETFETGYLLQFRLKNGVRTAHILFDCDKTRPIEVPVGDIAHLGDEDQEELECFLDCLSPFAEAIRTLFETVLSLEVNRPRSQDAYKAKMTRKENVEVLESEHPYSSGEEVTYPLDFQGAHEIVIYFDRMSCTAGPNDYVRFLKRADSEESGKAPGVDKREHWGQDRYYGDSFPGVGSIPPLHIPASSVDVYFHTDASSSIDPSAWGFKLTAHAFEDTLSYPPEVPPLVIANALNDVRARCLKAMSLLFRLQQKSDSIAVFAPLVSSLAKIANEPSDGRPTCSMPKSQVFESKHPYSNSVLEYMGVTFNGASMLHITFDEQSRTEHGCDYLCFFKDKTLTDRWGAHQYSGADSAANWPGSGGRPALTIPSDSFTLLWCTDISNVDWGWKFTVTPEFKPVAPLSLSFDQLDQRSYHLFEILYEKMNPQRSPFPEEFEGFEVVSDNREDAMRFGWTKDPTRRLLLASNMTERSPVSAQSRLKNARFCVIDEAGVRIYKERSRGAVIGELSHGDEFFSTGHKDGWLALSSGDSTQNQPGWIWQRTGERIHVVPVDSFTRHEDLFVLGVDDTRMEVHHPVLEMDESNPEHDELSNFLSQFSFESLKGQHDRFQSCAYDSHRAFATKCAREALVSLFSCPSTQDATTLSAFGDENQFLLLLAHLFPQETRPFHSDTKTGSIEVLGRRLRHFLDNPRNDIALQRLFDRCVRLLSQGPALLPVGRGVLRVVESVHPYNNDMDQYWQVSIPGAKQIIVTFDPRSKSEAGCDWLCFYKEGSNRTETFGDAQYGGREGTENWPGCGGRSALTIDASAFEVYFHSDGKTNDWGFKLFAVGVFDGDEAKDEEARDSDVGSVLLVLNICCWVVEILSAALASEKRNLPVTKHLYSFRTLETMIVCLKELPQQVRPSILQILINMAQCPSLFHKLPPVLVERMRDVVNLKLRAQYRTEEAVESKSHYLQMLVQCAVAVHFAIESGRFHLLLQSPPQLRKPQLLLLSESMRSPQSCEWINEEFRSTKTHQYQIVLKKATTPFSVGIWVSTPQSSETPKCVIEWSDAGDLCVYDAGKNDRIELQSFASPLSEGDTASFQLDFDEHVLILRKNNLIAGVVANDALSGGLVTWDALGISGFEDRALTAGAVSSDPKDEILVWTVSTSPLSLLSTCIDPSWYGKIVDAVGTMLDFRESRAAHVVMKESSHPLRAEASSRKHATIQIPGAVALEIKFDKQSKLRKKDCIQFCTGSSSTDEGPKASVSLFGLNGHDDQIENPLLFVPDAYKRTNTFLRVGDHVVRSCDWEYGDEDGGIGSVGIVEEIVPWDGRTGAGVRVAWRSSGKENVYRHGFHGRFDVQLHPRSRYRDFPLVIPGDSLSYSVQYGETKELSLAFASELDDFQGSLQLRDAVALKLELSDAQSADVLNPDSTLEMWMEIDRNWLHTSDGQSDTVYMELFRIGNPDSSAILSVWIDRAGELSIMVDRGLKSGSPGNCVVLANEVDSSSAIDIGAWVHFALVVAGSKILLYRNGERCYAARRDRMRFAVKSVAFNGRDCSRSSGKKVSPFCGHLYDVRLWDVALKVEQLKSHVKGLDSVSSSSEAQSQSSSLPGTPRAFKQPLSPFLVPPSPPRSPSRSAVIPSHLKRWATTNRTGKEMVSVRLNASIKESVSPNARETDDASIVYYEAHPLSSGKISIGWMWTHAVPDSGDFVVGESTTSFGIEPQKRVAHFRGETIDLEPFTFLGSSGLSSPRGSNGSINSFSSDFFIRSGDVIGCAFARRTSELIFYINGQYVARVGLHDALSAAVSKETEEQAEVPSAEAETKQDEFDHLVDEMCSMGFSRRSSTEALASSGADNTLAAVDWLLQRDQNDVASTSSTSTTASAPPPCSPRKRSVKSRSNSESLSLPQEMKPIMQSGISPAATLGPQGAQGVVWNLGQNVFKYRPTIVEGNLVSVLEASGCSEEELTFEVYDPSERNWQQVAYRHKVQDIVPRMMGWWKLDEGLGSTVVDSSGNNNFADAVLEDGSDPSAADGTSSSPSLWDHSCSPPFLALRRNNSDGTSPSPFLSASSSERVAPEPTATTTESVWGYRFYVIPHFSLDSIGHQRFQDPVFHLCETSRGILLRHDKQLVKYVNKVAQAKQMSVFQLLRATWSDIAPREDELVRWPTLLEIATGVASAGGENEESAQASTIAKSSGILQERLATRFKVLQEFNASIHRVLPYVGFHTPPVSEPSSHVLHANLLSELVSEQRHRIFNLVKRVVWDEALRRTNETSVAFELTLNRPKAMRHRGSGKPDMDGRYALFSQAFRQLNSLDGTHFRRADNFYHVNFLGENAQDAGGPYRETLAQYCEELHSAQLPLLLPTSNSQHNVGAGREKWILHPGANTGTLLQMYEFLGKLMGVVLRSKQYLSLNVASMVWKKLVGELLHVEDLAAVDSMIVNSMKKMRTIDTYGVTEEMFEDIVLETFTTLSSDNRVVALKPNGQSIAVTFANRCEYADLVEKYRLQEFDLQVAALFRGISKVVPAKLLSCFTGMELELMVCGTPEIDVDLLEKCTEYSSCSASDDHIVWFWQVLRSFSHEERSAFLRFVWGRSRLPAHEKEFPQLFKLQSFSKAQPGCSVDGYLPIAHTCFFSVEMPMYSSEQVLREKLLYAIYNCQEIDGDGDSVAANQLGWEE